jgi:hypothetical protein
MRPKLQISEEERILRKREQCRLAARRYYQKHNDDVKVAQREKYRLYRNVYLENLEKKISTV